LGDNIISVTSERVVYDGQLGKLQQHSHATLALLVGVEQPFSLSAAGVTSSCSLALVPAGVEHELDFFGARAIVVYVEPHDAEYAGFHRAAAGSCRAANSLSAPWLAAIATWSQRRDCRPLLTCAAEAFRTSPAALDRRVLDLAAHFNRGELLDAEMPEMAARVGLSSSRLVHLIKSELGVGVRRLKQHYRFKVVARAAADGQNLTTAAHAAGFADSGHFSRTFLQTFGMSPSKVLLRGIGTDYLT
jgi:AraC-like DNA-binding protein